MRWTAPSVVERLLGGLAIALLSLGACRGPLDAPLPPAHPLDGTPRHGGTLHLASTGDVSTLDPVTAADHFTGSVIRLLYAGLVDVDASGRVVPDLASKIDVSSDGLTYTFTLRDGVRFQDGSDVTAAEVKRSLERALSPSTPSPVASFFDSIEGFATFEAKEAAHLSGLVVAGGSVLEIHLAQRDAPFLDALALSPLRITCPSAGERYSASWTPCGAGPFRLPKGGWERGRTLTLERNPDYFRPGIPYLDAVTWELGSTLVGEGFKFARGGLDLVGDLTVPDTVRYQSDPRWQPLGSYGGSASNSVQGDALNTEIPPFDNVEIRRAVAAAVDRRHLVLLRSSNLEQSKPVPPLPGYDPPGIGQTHDLATALAHMRRAGYAFDPATGRGGWPAIIPYDTYRGPEIAAQSIQEDLAKIGLRLELRVESYATFVALSHKRRTSAISPQGWQADFLDPSDYLEPRFASKSMSDEDGLNYAFYSNRKVDSLLERARRDGDEAQRMRLYAEVERILCDDAPWAFEYAFRFYQVRQPYVRGYRVHAMWTTDVMPLWLDRLPEVRARIEAPLTRELLGSLSGRAP